MGIIGYSVGALSALMGLAGEQRGKARFGAAVLGFLSTDFLPLGPGCLPPPPCMHMHGRMDTLHGRMATWPHGALCSYEYACMAA